MNADDAERSIYSFVRRDGTGKNSLLFIVNMTPMERNGYMVGAPHAGRYTLLLDRDGAVSIQDGKRTQYTALKGECDHQKYHLTFDLPPYGCAIFKFNEK
jgi:1,4-alpha-glucan branching enzyme